MAANPFTPGFGTSPRILVGREEVLGEIGAAFGSVLDPHRTTWLRAPRGSGKTVLLDEIQDLAAHAGWLVVQEDAQSPGRLPSASPSACRAWPASERNLVAVSAPLR